MLTFLVMRGAARYIILNHHICDYFHDVRHQRYYRAHRIPNSPQREAWGRLKHSVSRVNGDNSALLFSVSILKLMQMPQSLFAKRMPQEKRSHKQS